MKKRAGASKRAMAELLSNSTDKENNSVKTELKTADNREKLKLELMGDVEFAPRSSKGTAPFADDGKKISQTQSPVLQTPEAKRVQTPSAINQEVAITAAVPDAAAQPRVNAGMQNTAAQPKVNAGMQNTAVQPRVNAGMQNAAAQPRVNAGMQNTTAQPKVNAGMQNTAAQPKVNAGMQNTATFGNPVMQGTASFGNTALQQKNVPNKKSSSEKKEKKRRGKGIAVVISTVAVIVAAVTVGGIYLYLNREEDFIPADVTAGLAEAFEVNAEEAVSTNAQIQYPTENRYSVKFTFYEKPEVICTTTETTVASLMEKLNITVGADNRCSMSGEDILSADSVVDIQTVTYETVSKEEAVPYETEYVDVRTIPKGSTKVNKAGKNGVKTYTYKLTLVNGVEESRELVSEAVTTKPVTRIMYRGVGGTVTSQGKTYNYSYYIDVKATVYNIVGTTASGLPTSTSVMAVDPRVIPLGSKCVVTGGSGDYGYRIAADTGGAIKGNKIDLWYPAGTFNGFGWRSTRVYILE